MKAILTKQSSDRGEEVIAGMVNCNSDSVFGVSDLLRDLLTTLFLDRLPETFSVNGRQNLQLAAENLASSYIVILKASSGLQISKFGVWRFIAIHSRCQVAVRFARGSGYPDAMGEGV